MLNNWSMITRLLLAWAMFTPAFLHSAEGRVYVKSDPDGANVYVVRIENGNTIEYAIQQTTPVLVPLEVRVEPYELILRREGFKEKRVSVQVSKAAIIKPDVQKMEPATKNTDVIFTEDGWQVFVDGKAVNDVEGHIAKTPCTVQLPEGAKEVAIAKEGFLDLFLKVEQGAALEFKGKPWKGQSKLLTSGATSPDVSAAKPSWKDALDISQGEVVEDFIRSSVAGDSIPTAMIRTKEEYDGDLEITAIARTDGKNIRLFALGSALLIFNWEVNPRELRIHQPGAQVWNAGEVMTARASPLSADTWHTLTWKITSQEMTVEVNGKQVFVRKGKFNVSQRSPVGISGALGSVVDIKFLAVKAVQKKK